MRFYLSIRQVDLLDVLLSSDLACCEDESLALEIKEIRDKMRQSSSEEEPVMPNDTPARPDWAQIARETWRKIGGAAYVDGYAEAYIEAALRKAVETRE